MSGIPLLHTPETAPSPLPQAAPARPLSLAWITDDLVRYTQEVWSEYSDRPISEDEAVEMLLSVKRLAEVLLKAESMKGGPGERRDLGEGVDP